MGKLVKTSPASERAIHETFAFETDISAVLSGAGRYTAG